MTETGFKRLLATLAVTICLSAGLSFITACGEKQAVTVEKALPQVTYTGINTADKRRQNSEDVEAYTEWLYSCTVKFDYDTVASDDTAGGATCELKITGVHIKLALPISVHLPPKASQSLKNHEAGHVQICSMAYGRADKAAYDAGRLVLGQVYSGNGANLAEAREMALHQPEKIIAIDFQDAASVICDQASAKYEEYCRRDEADPKIDCPGLARSAYQNVDSIESIPIK